MKIERNLRRSAIKAKGLAIDKAGTSAKGALGKLNVSLDADSLQGRGKAKRDAKAAKKVNKASAPSKKQVKANKSVAKNKLKVSKGKAKEARAKNGNPVGVKVLDTLNKGIDTLGKGFEQSKMPEAIVASTEVEKQQAEEPKKAFSFTAWYMILIYLVIIGVILYFVFFNKKK